MLLNGNNSFLGVDSAEFCEGILEMLLNGNNSILGVDSAEFCEGIL